MDFEIFEEYDSIDSICTELKKRKNRIVLYGKGEYANILYPQLLLNNLTIDEVVADEKFITGNKIFKDFNVMPIETVLSDGVKTDVIIAFGAWRDYLRDIKKWRTFLEEKLNSFCRCNQYFYYDCYARIDRKFVDINFQKFSQTFSLFCDEKSKLIMNAFINQRISGKINYIEEFSEENQYVPKDIINFSDGEAIVDCGAYTGDTIDVFISRLENDKIKEFHIWALEPCSTNINILKMNYENNANVSIIEKGAWKREGELLFRGDAFGGKFTEEISAENLIEVDSLDNILDDTKVTFIKMDIEGGELAALMGAQNIIKQNKPKLAICVYHTKNDLIEIPQYIKSLHPEYKFYLRAHGGILRK